MLRHQNLAWLAALLFRSAVVPAAAFAFCTPPCSMLRRPTPLVATRSISSTTTTTSSTTTTSTTTLTTLQVAAVPDLDVIALVAGQENYGLAVVCVGEAVWSFFQAPSLSHAKVLVPAAVAAIVLVAVSGPMIMDGSDVSRVGTGLWIATSVSLGLAASYVARLVAPYSPSPKEIAAFGLLVAIAGFFSFSQNLVVDGFVTLPSIALPSLPSIELPSLF